MSELDNRPRSPRTFVVWGYIPCPGVTMTRPGLGSWSAAEPDRFEVVCHHAEDARRTATELRAAGFERVGWSGAESQRFERRPATDEDGPGFTW